MLSASILLGSSLGTPVFAENTTTGSTQVNYTVDESYDWTAPADIVFTSNSNGSEVKTGNVNVTKNTIGSCKMLTIGIASDQTFELTDTANSSNKRTFTVKDGSTALSAGSEVLSVEAGTDTASKNLSIQMTSVGTEVAGTYSGTLRFVSNIISLTEKAIEYVWENNYPHYIDLATGKSVLLNGFSHTGYTPIDTHYTHMRTKATFLYEGDGIALYDADKNYIEGYGNADAVDGWIYIELPENARYFRQTFIAEADRGFAELEGYFYCDTSVVDYPSNILYVGNSLLLGFGNHGMASSEVGKDYYSLVNNYIEEQIGESVTADRLAGSDLERAVSDDAANAWMEEYLKPCLSEERELVIIQLGDNVNNATVFAHTANNVIQYIHQYAPNAEVAWVAMWYNANTYLNTIKNACTNNDAVFIDIHDLNVSANRNVVGAEYIDKDGNVETITDSGVASHPNDRGFQQIAHRIITTLF